MKSLLFSILFLVTSLNFLSEANAIEGVYEVIIRKQQEKQASRWTLADWLLTKQKMALMDQWLALNSSTTWFEFFLEGSGKELTGDEVGDGRDPYDGQAYRYQAALYFRAFGLQGGQDKFSGFSESTFYQANLILLGSSAQSTNIQLHYGIKNTTILSTSPASELSPTYWGASSTLYILPFLGGLYEYRKYGDDSSGSLTLKGGSRQEVGGFIDVWFLRLKGTYFKERLQLNNTARGDFDQHISGWWAGAQLFF